MKIFSLGAVSVISTLFLVGTVHAEALVDALVSAYTTNPTLQARRAQSRAADEAVPQALSNWRPTVTASGDLGRGAYNSNEAVPQSQIGTPRDASLTITQTLYRGGRTVAATAQAESGVQADRAQLTGTEQSVLLDAATAYVNVVRDMAVLKLNINNEQVLQRQLQASQDRFRVGEITRTDVAQSEARLAGATAGRIKSEGDLEASRSSYERVVGVAPQSLLPPESIKGLPDSVDAAVAQAIKDNPNLVAAQYAHDAANHGIDVVRGALLPTVSLKGDVQRSFDQASHGTWARQAEAMLNVSVPLYEQGAVYSQLRQAKNTAGQQRLQVDDTRRQVIDATHEAWESLQSARAQIVSLRAQIEAANIALEGVQRESQVGSRTVLDVLNAEQELLNARVGLEQAERSERVAEFTLMNATGQLTARGLALPVERYDPTIHYHEVRDQWFGDNPTATKDAAEPAKAK
ncbi:MAG: TolC family outer membrane protein [Alphaproteobacteria bacterium]|nr:TolC family outer membrane protein [Alphaproteobacteria bacterium]